MIHHPNSVGLMLMLLCLLSLLGLSASYPHRHQQPQSALAGRDPSTPATKYPIPVKGTTSSFHAKPATSCSGGRCIGTPSAIGSLPCNDINGTTLARENGSQNYSIICDVDFPGQDIYPFILVASFDECLGQCEKYNKNGPDTHCAGFVFAPDRINGADDCYLKSSLDEPGPATVHLIGATLIPSAASSTSTPPAKSFPTPRHEDASPSSSLSVGDFRVLGTSTNKPAKQYVSHPPYKTPQKLYDDAYIHTVEEALVTDYPLADDTGSWTESKLSNPTLADMTVVPHLSRDGGKGGNINGTQIFVFCDTESYQGSNMVSFVSSSVATDEGMRALYGDPLNLVDNLGEWQDDVGRMRGFAPMTTGEQSYNIDVSGQGYRYAVWPESSLIPLNSSHSLLYPALVYDIDMHTQNPVFNEIGNTVLLVSVDPTYGPAADRVVKQLYKQGEIAFGTLGGIRSWGAEGDGGNDGQIYLFGQHKGQDGASADGQGVLVAKTTPDGITDLTTYTYWDGNTWTNTMPSSDSKAVMLDHLVQDLDVFYVPALRSFVMVYLNVLTDNTFYYRHLPLDLGADPKGDYVENILTSKWSEEKVLATIDAPPKGFIYTGAVHAGYFGNEDITNGGWKMLVTWTENTGKDAAAPESGYAHKSAYVQFSLD